ncbi:ABC transporter ATP-binding protein [Raineyella fluvialis]|uniref:Fatty acid ABC transporter ATP-binding/permease protein n=1 Tax=Raineyella fluvialis TaxID=2662261 RepID=A0A5Q2FKF7_9ACTN|nr:ABC transporter ATP-binding protein [Raineyella fluvialis]QGF24826.1 ATP-binding cassette domain-containing protein [Raineyella fluvialis]
MRSLVRILSTTKELWPSYLGIVLSSVLMSVTSLVTPFLIGRATDEVVALAGGRGGTTRTIVLIALALLAAELLNTVLTNVGGYLGDTMTARLRQILSTRYFEKLLGLPQRYFDNELSGTIIGRLSRSIAEVTNFLKSFSNNFFTMLITTVAVLVISAFYAWPLAVLLAVMFPAYMWLTARTSSNWQRLEGEKNEQVDIANGRFSEVIGQIRVVKSFVRERAELAAFDQRYGRTIALTRQQARHWHGMDTARRAVLNVAFLGIYLVIFLQTAHGVFTVGVMVLLIQLMNMARQPVMMMSFIIDSGQRAIAGSVSYFEVMDETVEERATVGSVATAVDAGPEGPQAPARTIDDHVIAFHEVDFAYEPGRPVLRDVTFHADAGERIALVGESGGGKSTLVNLLLGLYPPDAGRVTLQGQETASLPLDVLRRRVGVVFQDPSLFSGTIRENIAYGRPDATDEEVREAARRANADRFIERFPEGYEALIGERGVKLSGGQKQRVAVARAMLKDAPVLVLDEATSSLDTKSERLVQEGLEELMTARTTLIIAHRLSTISSVDRIVTLRDGRVDEIGTPEQLATSGGIYAELLTLQASNTLADRARLKAFGIDAGGADTGDPDGADLDSGGVHGQGDGADLARRS